MNSPQTFNLSTWGLSTRYDLSYTIRTLAYMIEYTRGGGGGQIQVPDVYSFTMSEIFTAEAKILFSFFWPLKSHFRLFKIIKAFKKAIFSPKNENGPSNNRKENISYRFQLLLTWLLSMNQFSQKALGLVTGT